MITGKGVGALASACAIYLLARLTQVGWLYLVDAIFWGALALALIVPWFGVVFISAHRSASTKDNQKSGGPFSEGDPVTITIALKNRLFYPRFFHSIKYDSPIAGPDGAKQWFFIAYLPGSGLLPLESTVEAYRRGLHDLGPVVLESSAPFGFFLKKRTLSGPEPFLVLPRVYPLNRLVLVDGLEGWSVNARTSRNGLDLAGSRFFVQGDSRRMVHWRNTARSGRLMVKETEDQTNRTVHIMFDSGDVWGSGRETNFEYAIKLAASVANYALKNRVPVRVWGSNFRGSNFAAADSSTDLEGVTLAWSDLLESLAVAQPAGRAALVEGLANLPTGANLFIVLSADDVQSHENLIRALAHSGETVVVRLEGFGEPQSPGYSANSLQQAGSSVVTCNPGGLEQTLSDIENLGRSNDFGSYAALTGMTSAGDGHR